MMMQPITWSLVRITPGTNVDLVRVFRSRTWPALELKTQDALETKETCQLLVCERIEQEHRKGNNVLIYLEVDHAPWSTVANRARYDTLGQQGRAVSEEQMQIFADIVFPTVRK